MEDCCALCCSAADIIFIAWIKITSVKTIQHVVSLFPLLPMIVVKSCQDTRTKWAEAHPYYALEEPFYEKKKNSGPLTSLLVNRLNCDWQQRRRSYQW